MAKIIKFPHRKFCDDCAQPLAPDQGKTCLKEGCDNTVCGFCEDVSLLCMEHMKEAIRKEQSAHKDRSPG